MHEKKSNKWQITSIILMVIVVALAAGGVYLYMQNRDKQDKIDATQTSLSNLENQIASFASTQASSSSSSDDTVTSQSSSYGSDPIAVATAYSHTMAAGETYEYSIATQTNDAAKINVKISDGPGYMVILKKADDVWVPVYSGQQDPSVAIVEQYGLPSNWALEQ